MDRDDIDSDLTAQQREDLGFGQWIGEQRKRQRVEMLVCFLFGIGFGVVFSRFFH